MIPNLAFPLFLLAVLAGVGGQVTKVKGFPTDNYVSFIIGGMLVQAAAGAMTLAGTEFGTDIQSGFLRRLSLTRVQGSALIVAQLAGVMVLGLLQVLLLLGVGLAAGATIETGVGGAIAFIAFMVLLILAFGAVGLLIALRTGSAERVQPMFALMIGLFFLSSMSMPRNLITEDWFKIIATYNPLSYPVEAARSLFITGWDSEALLLGVGITIFFLVVGLTGAAVNLRREVT